MGKPQLSVDWVRQNQTEHAARDSSPPSPLTCQPCKAPVSEERGNPSNVPSPKPLPHRLRTRLG